MTRRIRLPLFAFALACLVLPLSNRGAAEDISSQTETPRIWKDRSGQFSISAIYVGVDDDKVILRGADGKEIRVPLAKLTDDDAKFAREHQSKAGPAPKSNTSATKASSLESAFAPIAATQTKADRSKAKVIKPKTFSSWTFKPESPPITINPKLDTNKMESADIPGVNTFFERVVGLGISGDGNRLIITRGGDDFKNSIFFVQAVDLLQGRATEPVALPQRSQYGDALMPEALVAYFSDPTDSGYKNVLTIARLGKKDLKPQTSWKPMQSDRFKASWAYKEVWFLNAQRLLTAGDTIDIWDTATAQLLMTIPVESSIGNIALSQDRRYLALPASKGIAIVDLQQGTHVATIPVEESQFGAHFAFSDDNRRLASVSDSGLTVWDLTTGKQTWHHQDSLILGFGRPSWTGPFVCVSGKCLFDIDKKLLLWEYTGNHAHRHDNRIVRAGRVWDVKRAASDKLLTIVTTPMPHTQALDIAKKIASNDSSIVARPGDKFAVKVDVEPGTIDADSIRKEIVANLESAGFKVADNSDLLVTAVCKRLPTQTIKINTKQPGGIPEPKDIVEKTITPHQSSMELTHQGKRIWQRGYEGQPGGMIFLNQGESLDQGLARITSPNINLYKNTKFAPYIFAGNEASEAGAFGISDIVAEEKF